MELECRSDSPCVLGGLAPQRCIGYAMDGVGLVGMISRHCLGAFYNSRSRIELGNIERTGLLYDVDIILCKEMRA